MADIKPIDLKKPTVFILGAGASNPYGLPLGTELKAKMISSLSNPDCQSILRKNGFDKSLVDDFVQALSGTYHPTIDIFLEKKTEFRSLGSYLIAYTLLPMENHHNLLPQRDWYEHLYTVIDFEHEEPDTENIVFVSLNYDRSLEHFLAKNIKFNCPSKVIQQAESKLNSLNIIHAHGSLGNYPELPYGENPVKPDVLRRASEGIRIVSDRLEDSEDFQSSKAAISIASNIVFIGFGYDSYTLQSLIQDINLSDKRVLGTIYKLDKSRIDGLMEFFKGKFETYNDVSENASLFISRILLPIK